MAGCVGQQISQLGDFRNSSLARARLTTSSHSAGGLTRSTCIGANRWYQKAYTGLTVNQPGNCCLRLHQGGQSDQFPMKKSAIPAALFTVLALLGVAALAQNRRVTAAQRSEWIKFNPVTPLDRKSTRL